jgi:hypothetical protein
MPRDLGPIRLPSSLVSTEEAVGALTCELCGSPCTDVEGGRDWTHLEVTREQLFEGGHWLSADFCSQAHAAEWLARPLPEQTPPGEPVPVTWEDRLATAAALSVLLGIAGLFGLGLWTALRFVVGLF